MKKFKFLLPSIITFIILGIIYYFNDLYPFGTNPLVQVDADFQFIPTLYKIYDLLHLKGNLFYTGIGLGNAIYGSLIIQGSLYSPLNLLLYFVNRNNLVNFMGLFIIIKISLISLTSYIYIDNKYKNINYYFKVLFSILYSFNGFIILNYFNDMWLDIVILFPLLVLYLDKLLNDKNITGYIIILSLCFIISIYFSIFLIIFILLYSFIEIFFSKKDKKEVVFNLGKGTVISLLISSFSSIPLIYQIFNSARFNDEGWTNIFSDITMKSLYILFSPLFLILFIKLVSKYKKDKINIYKRTLLFVLYFIPLILNPINMLMHGGDYWDFPYRYGFIMSFILMDNSLYYINNFVKNKYYKIKIKDIICIIFLIVIGIIGIKLNYQYRSTIIDKGILLDMENKEYIYIIYMVLCVFLMYIFNLLINHKKLKYVFLSITSLYSIFLFTSYTIYYNSGYFLCKNAMELYNTINYPSDGIYKIEYETYTPDWGLIFNIDTLDNWLHILPNGEKEAYERLGYHTSGSSVDSHGGTIFTDYLLNFKYLFSYDESKDDMYKYISDNDNKYLYQYNYHNSYGIIFNELKDITYNGNRFSYQNDIYHNLFNSKKDIVTYNTYEIKDNKEYKLNYHIDTEGYLYFDTLYYEDIDYLIVNDKYYGSIENYIKFLGYQKEDVEINIYLKEKTDINFNIGFIKKDDIINLSSNVLYKDNSYHVYTDEESYLFIPINNIKGLKVYNNNLEVDTYKYLDNFLTIKLNKGENNISIKYKLPLFKLSIAFTLIGIILFIFYKKIIPNNIILKISYWTYMILIIFIYLYYYMYSFIKFCL